MDNSRGSIDACGRPLPVVADANALGTGEDALNDEIFVPGVIQTVGGAEGWG